MFELIIAALVIGGIVILVDAFEKLGTNKWKQSIFYRLFLKKKKRKKK